MSELILNLTNRTYDYILIATLVFYIIALIICIKMVKNKDRKMIPEDTKKEAVASENN